MLKSCEAEFKIVTPMFLGNVDQETSVIHPASVKGAIVFWWRVLNFHKYTNDAGVPDYEKFRNREKYLFGSDKAESKVRIRVSPGELSKAPKNSILGMDGTTNTGNPAETGITYLGYGLMGAFGSKQAKLERSCVLPDQDFNVKFLFHPNLKDKYIGKILEAVELFGLIGGLGSRVRRGFGSVALQKNVCIRRYNWLFL